MKNVVASVQNSDLRNVVGLTIEYLKTGIFWLFCSLSFVDKVVLFQNASSNRLSKTN